MTEKEILQSLSEKGQLSKQEPLYLEAKKLKSKGLIKIHELEEDFIIITLTREGSLALKK